LNLVSFAKRRVAYPADNKHVQDAVASYRTCLTDFASFAEWTLENFIGCLRKHTAQDWVNRFIDRYLSFDKINTRLDAEDLLYVF
jgi:hypothetical protein